MSVATKCCYTVMKCNLHEVIMDLFVKHFGSFMSDLEVVDLHNRLLKAYENETEFLKSIFSADEYLSIYANRNQELGDTEMVCF